MMITENRQEVFYMLREGMNGFCMALADSVPGVSGGTVAFILGFYDRFIGSINDFVFGKKENFFFLSGEAWNWLDDGHGAGSSSSVIAV